MQPEKSSLPKNLFQIEGVILVILTATSYAAFLAREMGYADYFSIPQELIATSHIGLISAAKALIWGGMAYIGKVNLVWILAPRADGFLYSFLRHTISACLILGFAMYPYIATDGSWWWYFIVFSILGFSAFIWPLITQRGVKGYENKIVEQARLESGYDDIYKSMFSGFDSGMRITLIFVVAIIVFAYGDGRRSAIEQEFFNRLEGDPNAIVLRIYGDVLISANFDPKTRQLDGLIRIQKMEGGKWLAIRETKLGRLKKPMTK